jgi:pimeloyl-ACP methyl ester carboxylesterase
MELIEAGGRKIAYRRAGAGDPLVLLQGAWSDGREWRPQLTGLSDEFDVIAWDAPGCGGSDDSPPGMVFASRARISRGRIRLQAPDVVGAQLVRVEAEHA